MISVLMEAGDDAEALANTLGCLVGAAIEGVVREVLVLAADRHSEAARVADHAGCDLLMAEPSAALARAKCGWLLLLEPGARPGEGWTEAVREHVATSDRPARFSPARSARPFLSRFRRRRPLELGLLIPAKAAAMSPAGAGLSAIAVPSRPIRLPAGIAPARA